MCISGHFEQIKLIDWLIDWKMARSDVRLNAVYPNFHREIKMIEKNHSPADITREQKDGFLIRYITCWAGFVWQLCKEVVWREIIGARSRCRHQKHHSVQCSGVISWVSDARLLKANNERPRGMISWHITMFSSRVLVERNVQWADRQSFIEISGNISCPDGCVGGISCICVHL